MFCKRLLLHLGIRNGEHSSQDLGAKYILIFIFKEKYTVWKFCPNNLFRWRATYFSTIDNTALCKDINLCISRGIIFQFKSLRNDKNSLTCCGVYIAYWLLFTIFPQLFRNFFLSFLHYWENLLIVGPSPQHPACVSTFY